ncbi:hypothetical protein IWZ01DRAFT_198908 [Phyllosticta capitalensis]
MDGRTSSTTGHGYDITNNQWTRNRHFESISFTYSQFRFVCVASFSIIAIPSKKKVSGPIQSNPIQSRIQIPIQSSRIQNQRGQREKRRKEEEEEEERHSHTRSSSSHLYTRRGNRSRVIVIHLPKATNVQDVIIARTDALRGEQTTKNAAESDKDSSNNATGAKRRQTDKLDKEREKSLENKRTWKRRKRANPDISWQQDKESQQKTRGNKSKTPGGKKKRTRKPPMTNKLDLRGNHYHIVDSLYWEASKQEPWRGKDPARVGMERKNKCNKKPTRKTSSR